MEIEYVNEENESVNESVNDENDEDNEGKKFIVFQDSKGKYYEDWIGDDVTDYVLLIAFTIMNDVENQCDNHDHSIYCESPFLYINEEHILQFKVNVDETTKKIVTEIFKIVKDKTSIKNDGFIKFIILRYMSILNENHFSFDEDNFIYLMFATVLSGVLITADTDAAIVDFYISEYYKMKAEKESSFILDDLVLEIKPDIYYIDTNVSANTSSSKRFKINTY